LALRGAGPLFKSGHHFNEQPSSTRRPFVAQNQKANQPAISKNAASRRSRHRRSLSEQSGQEVASFARARQLQLLTTGEDASRELRADKP
jgi:hypothetical protein